jgi:hypothetical protein
VVESDNGGGGIAVGTTSSVTVDGATVDRSLSTLTVGSTLASETVVVQFTNTYSALLPASGTGRVVRFAAVLGALFIAAGLALLALRRRRTSAAG